MKSLRVSSVSVSARSTIHSLVCPRAAAAALVALSLAAVPLPRVSARLPIDDIRPPIDGEIKELELPERLEVPVRFIRGDTNGNGTVELADAVTTLSSLFLGTKVLSCADAADSNDDGLVAISDAIHTLSFLFLGGVSMPAPYPTCDVDPTADALLCDDASSCRPETGEKAFQVTPVEDGYLIDLPASMVASLPDSTDLNLRVERTKGSSAISGAMTKLSDITIHVAVSVQSPGMFERLGTTAGVLRLNVAAGSVAFPRLAFDCGVFVCGCSGDDDCNDMFTRGVCGGDAVCVEDGAGGVWCICWKG